MGWRYLRTFLILVVCCMCELTLFQLTLYLSSCVHAAFWLADCRLRESFAASFCRGVCLHYEGCQGSSGERTRLWSVIALLLFSPPPPSFPHNAQYSELVLSKFHPLFSLWFSKVLDIPECTLCTLFCLFFAVTVCCSSAPYTKEWEKICLQTSNKQCFIYCKKTSFKPKINWNFKIHAKEKKKINCSWIVGIIQMKRCNNDALKHQRLHYQKIFL